MLNPRPVVKYPHCHPGRVVVLAILPPGLGTAGPGRAVLHNPETIIKEAAWRALNAIPPH